MTPPNDKELLGPILEECTKIENPLSRISQSSFLHDTDKQDATMRRLEIIGDASKLLSQQLKDTLFGIPWEPAARIRDRLIHGYFSVDLLIVWNTTQIEVPKIQAAIKAYLDSPRPVGE